MPTLRQLQVRHPDAVMKWFARGRLWESDEQERAESFAKRRPAPGDRRPPSEDRRPRTGVPAGTTRIRAIDSKCRATRSVSGSPTTCDATGQDRRARRPALHQTMPRVARHLPNLLRSRCRRVERPPRPDRRSPGVKPGRPFGRTPEHPPSAASRKGRMDQESPGGPAFRESRRHPPGALRAGLHPRDARWARGGQAGQDVLVALDARAAADPADPVGSDAPLEDRDALRVGDRTTARGPGPSGRRRDDRPGDPVAHPVADARPGARAASDRPGDESREAAGKAAEGGADDRPRHSLQSEERPGCGGAT